MVDAILEKHDAATGGRKFNAILATAPINDAIEYYELFKKAQGERQGVDPRFAPLNVAAVFSPPGDVSPDVRQIQEDLPQERADNQQDPEGKKEALTAIIEDYNEQFGTNHSIGEFDLYYQDVQKRIKDQQFLNGDLPKRGREKIDLTVVVDMLLTDAHINKIIETYQKRPSEVERYARRVEMKEIIENDYNLNISRYVGTAEQEAEVDLAATHANLVKIEDELRKATSKHNRFLIELGLPPIPPADAGS